MKKLTTLIRVVIASALALVVSACTLNPLEMPLPGGADVGDDPYEVTIQFRDVLDLVPQSAVRVDDIAVGRVKSVELKGWTAEVTILLNADVKLPDNAVATIRQTSLLGEKFVSLAPPSTGATGELGDGDEIPLELTGRNPEVEEVLGAASMLFNNGGLDKVNTIVTELNQATVGNESEIKALLTNTEAFLAQIDVNKDALLTALEKVNNLAITANAQEDAIVTALDELPEALTVLDEQRADLVTLMTALERLGDTATSTIAASKADTVANLQDLQPVLANLAIAAEDAVNNLSTFLTYPFPDGVFGGSVALAQLATGSLRCPMPDDDVEVANTSSGCTGDWANLHINLDLDTYHLENLLRSIFGSVEGVFGTSTAAPELPIDGGEGGASQLTDMVQMLSGGASQAPAATPSPAPADGEPAAQNTAPACLIPGLLCRPTVAPVATTAPLANLLLGWEASA